MRRFLVRIQVGEPFASILTSDGVPLKYLREGRDRNVEPAGIFVLLVMIGVAAYVIHQLRHPKILAPPRVGRHITERDDLCHQRRALEYGVPFESIHLVSVFNRDEWTCRICGGLINPDARYPDPWSPSLDHRIPLSRPRSPGHVWSNVQASHLRCNVRKGAS